MSGSVFNFRDPGVNVLESVISTSGKYKAFLGVHYEAGHTCWVVGAISGITGIITSQHYNDGIQGCLAPKAQAYTSWETLKEKITEITDAYREETSYLSELTEYINKVNRVESKRPKSKPWVN